MANADRDMVPLPAWDVQIAAAFEQRLRWARPYNRAQYIRIQATHLLSSSGPQVRQAGRGLLRCLVTSFPDDFNAKMAMEQLGRSVAGEGRLPKPGGRCGRRCGCARRARQAGPARPGWPGSGWPK